jgi:hypothetical protein
MKREVHMSRNPQTNISEIVNLLKFPLLNTRNLLEAIAMTKESRKYHKEMNNPIPATLFQFYIGSVPARHSHAS